MRRSVRQFCVSPALLLTTSCSVPIDGGSSPEAPRVVVCGVDRSRSYEHPERALERCAIEIERARPGDRVAVYLIGANSYLSDAQIASVEIPRIPGCDPDNPFDPVCRQRQTQLEARVKRATASALRALRPRPSHATDLWGFVAVAAEQFAAAGDSTAERVLLMATDLEDTVAYDVQPDLSGVQIEIFGYQPHTADPARAREQQERWFQRLRDLGASSITLSRDPS